VVLADTSAWVWSRKPGQPEVRAAFRERPADDEIAACDAVVAELLFSARHPEEFELPRDRLSVVRRCRIREREWRRALDVMEEELLRRSALGHRSVRHVDLLIAAAAEAAAMPVLHDDEDFERIAAVTGRPVEWLAPKG
jgi:predicted nucleic acid-binding protein